MAAFDFSSVQNQLDSFCQRQGIIELAAFGSAVTSDFNNEKSDIDLLVTLPPSNTRTLFDFAGLIVELEAVFGRRVDLVDKCVLLKSGLPRSKALILSTAKILYTNDQAA